MRTDIRYATRHGGIPTVHAPRVEVPGVLDTARTIGFHLERTGLGLLAKSETDDEGNPVGLWLHHCQEQARHHRLEPADALALTRVGAVLDRRTQHFADGIDHLAYHLGRAGSTRGRLDRRAVSPDGFPLGEFCEDLVMGDIPVDESRRRYAYMRLGYWGYTSISALSGSRHGSTTTATDLMESLLEEADEDEYADAYEEYAATHADPNVTRGYDFDGDLRLGDWYEAIARPSTSRPVRRARSRVLKARRDADFTLRTAGEAAQVQKALAVLAQIPAPRLIHFTPGIVISDFDIGTWVATDLPRAHLTGTERGRLVDMGLVSAPVRHGARRAA